MSTSYHMQTDDQTKEINKFLEMYLHCFTSKKWNQWVQWFPLVECWYNTTYHEENKLTPYEAFYGKESDSTTSYLPRTSKVQKVQTLLQNCEWTLESLNANLAMDQNCMKQQVDQHFFECSFEVGDLGFLCLQPYKKTSLKSQVHRNIFPKLYWPYKVLKSFFKWPTSYFYLPPPRSTKFSMSLS